jgi:hypothetical protein
MKTLLLLLIVLMGAVSPSAGKVPDSSVQYRLGESLSSSEQWEICGALLITEEGRGRTAYVPLRRRGPVWDEGAVRKVLLDEELRETEIIWQTETEKLREVYRPLFQDGTVVSGKTARIQDFDSALAELCGMNSTDWTEAAEILRRKSMGAPYPAAMTLAGGVLYVLCDDGILCAISAETGRICWNLLLPHACFRLNYLLNARRDKLPWLCAGALTAEKTKDSRTCVWGTLGIAGRGVFCLGVSKESPLPLWAEESFDESVPEIISGCAGPLELGLSSAVPLCTDIRGQQTLIIPSGRGVQGKMLFFNARTGKFSCAVQGVSETELIFSPLGILGQNGRLEQILCCDSSGGVQSFLCRSGSTEFSSRTDLNEICGCGPLNFVLSPLGCRTVRGALAVFIAGCKDGTVIAAAPPRLKSLHWSESQRRTGSNAWWTLCEGFVHPFAVLYSDGILYLLGWQEGRKTLLAFDLMRVRTAGLAQVSASASGLISVSGRVTVLSDDGSAQPVYEIAGMEPVVKIHRSAGVVYTLQR